jgi:chlorobactene glucosyltransferase
MFFITWTLLILSAAATVTWGYINFAGGFKRSLQYRLPQADDPKPGQSAAPPRIPPAPELIPKVTILAPGRNEAEHLPTVLPELCEQDYRDAQGNPPTVVFIDDQSDDETPGICAALSERYANLIAVRNNQSPPTGWVGKCWAIDVGYRRLMDDVRSAMEDVGQAPSSITHRTSDIAYLCFTDADIHWHPSLLSTAMQHLHLSGGGVDSGGGDVLAVTPTLRFGSPIEAIVQLQLMLALGLMLPFEKAMDPAYPDVALCGGAFILVKREWYERVGRHEAVRDKVVEDLALGLKLKQAGAKMRVAMAGELQWCRMYDGWADMWEGLTKNAYAGLGYSPIKAIGLVLATLVLNVLPPAYVLMSLVMLLISPSVLILIALLLSIAAMLLAARALNATRKLVSLPGWYAFTMPIGAAIYSIFVLVSVWQSYTGGNRWKGRTYLANAP